MKKMISILLVLVMAFSLVACGNKTPDTPKEPTDAPVNEPSNPSVNPEEPVENKMEAKLKMIFTNDNITIPVTKLELDKAIKNAYEYPQSPDVKADKAILKSVVVEFYSNAANSNSDVDGADNVVAPLRLRFAVENCDLMQNEDFVLTWVKPETGELHEMIPGEFIAALESLNYDSTQVFVKCTFDAYFGDTVSEHDCTFTANTDIRQEFDVANAVSVPVVLYKDKTTVTLDILRLVQAMDLPELKSTDKLYLNIAVVDKFSEEAYFIWENYELTYDSTNPLVLEYKSDNIEEYNAEIYTDMIDFESMWYVCIDVGVNAPFIDAEETATGTYLATVDPDFLPDEEPQPTVPNEPVETPDDDESNEVNEEEDESADTGSAEAGAPQPGHGG
jgi:predicted small lipoprotein YifL